MQGKAMPPPNSAPLYRRAGVLAGGKPMMQRMERAHRDRRRQHRAFTREPNYAPSDLVVQISQRLRGVCAHLPPQEFEILVRRIAHVQWKFDERGRGDALSWLAERHWRS
jgi:hypothetical protein